MVRKPRRNPLFLHLRSVYTLVGNAPVSEVGITRIYRVWYSHGVKTVSKKEIELGLKWLRGEVGLNEAAKIHDVRHSHNMLKKLALFVREAYRTGRLND